MTSDPFCIFDGNRGNRLVGLVTVEKAILLFLLHNQHKPSRPGTSVAENLRYLFVILC